MKQPLPDTDKTYRLAIVRFPINRSATVTLHSDRMVIRSPEVQNLPYSLIISYDFSSNRFSSTCLLSIEGYDDLELSDLWTYPGQFDYFANDLDNRLQAFAKQALTAQPFGVLSPEYHIPKREKPFTGSLFYLLILIAFIIYLVGTTVMDFVSGAPLSPSVYIVGVFAALSCWRLYWKNSRA